MSRAMVPSSATRLGQHARRRAAAARRRAASVVAQALESRVMLSRIVYVDDTAPAGGNGTSWDLAWRDLRSALFTPQIGDDIHVAQGTYKPTSSTDRSASFPLKSGVAVRGGYAGYGAGQPDARNVGQYPTILSGDIGSGGINTDNSYHVVTATNTDATAILDGFVVIAGNASGTSTNSNGGGFYCNESSPTITNCIFEGNRSSGDGGAVYIQSSQNPQSPQASRPSFANCIFVGNAAGPSASGGAICNTGSPWSTLVNCTVTGNSAGAYGGGVYSPLGALVFLNNCIVWDNAAPLESVIYPHCSGLRPSCSDVQWWYSTTDGLPGDPCFVRKPSSGLDATWGTPDDDYGDLRLRLISPAIDAGWNAAVPANIIADLAGNPRFSDVLGKTDTGWGTSPLVDMGAYEVAPALAADAGAAYGVAEGATLVLRGVGNSNGGGPLTYAWDLDHDGQYDDATGPTPTFPAAALKAPAWISIALKVTDGAGKTAFASTTVRIAPAVVYVDDSAPANGDGTSWTNAYADLQSALAAAAPSQIIRVGQGTYKPGSAGNPGAVFVLPQAVGMYGGYAGRGAADPNARDISRYTSTLSGTIGLGSESINSYAVVVGNGTDAATVLDGFTVSGGGTTGMYNLRGSPTVRNCTFSGNPGSGMYNDNQAAPLVSGCTFVGNVSGGMSTSESAPTLVNCQISNNRGSGVSSSDTPAPILINCTLVANTSGGISGYNSSPVVANSIIWGNGVLPADQIRLSSTIVTYSDIQGGRAGAGNISGDPRFVRYPTAGPDGSWGNADDDYGDLRLSPASPAIDAGNNAVVPAGIGTDLVGNPRFSDIASAPDTGVGRSPIVDMGAHEVPVTLGADAGGPYRLLEGTTLKLHGAASNDPSGSVSYAWDLDGDGQYDDAVGPAPTFSAVGRLGPVTLSIGLQATDSVGNVATNVTTVLIAPAMAYVDAVAHGSGDGGSWVNAFTDLQAALTASAVGQTIRVGQGAYRPAAGSDPSATYQLCSGVTLLGGFAGGTAANPDAQDASRYNTVLSGDIGAPGNSSDNSYHVLAAGNVDATAVLDGFTVTAGNAGTSNSGGGLYVSGGSPTIRNCTFVSNSGSGVYSDHASPTFMNCIFSGNTAAYWGGGLYDYYSSPNLTNCTFASNSAGQYGGGMCNKNSSSPTLTNCTFVANSAGSSGGGMYNSFASAPVQTNCTFSANSASDGGGICDESSSSPRMTNCTFSGNLASCYGGGMYNNSSSPTMTNCTFVANSVGQHGGGMYNGYSSSLTITNCTFTRNAADQSGGGMYDASSSPTLTNCVFGGNSAAWYGGGIYNLSSGPSLTDCSFVGNWGAEYGGGVYDNASAPMLANCTFVDNLSTWWGGGMYEDRSSAVLANCILWANSASAVSQVYLYWGAIDYSDVQGGCSGTRNINADPLFLRNPSFGVDGKWGTADDDYGDLRLQLTSPCIDAGSNVDVPAETTTDLAGRPRFIDIPIVADTGSGPAPIVDMGAYEAVPELALTSVGGGYLSLTPDRQTLRLWQGSSPSGNPAATYPVGGFDALRFTGTAAKDTLTVDFSNGNPLPVGGFIFDGGGDADMLVLTGMSAADSLAVGSAQIALSSAVITPTSVESILLDNPSGSLIQLASLSLTDTARVSLPAAGGKMLKLGSLSIANTATLDLGTNSLIVQADAAVPTPDSVLSQVGTWIAQGRIIAPADAYRGLAAIRNDRGDGVAAMSRFGQQDVNSRSILVAYTLHGDSDLNGRIDASDYLRLDYGFLTGKSVYRYGDFNRSGSITADDYGLIDAAFLNQAQPSSRGAAPRPASARAAKQLGRFRTASRAAGRYVP